MQEKLQDEMKKRVENMKSSQIDLDLDLDVTINLLYLKLKEMNVCDAALDEFCLKVLDNKENYLQAMGSAMFSDLINTSVRTMVDIEERKNNVD